MSKIVALVLLFAIGGGLAVEEVLAASLSLMPPTADSALGEAITLNLHLDPEDKQVIGTDVEIAFDPAYVAIVDVASTHAFDQFPALDIDQAAGRLRFALVNNYNQYLTAAQTIATIKAKLLKVGKTNLTFKHVGKKTTDTNVIVSGGSDVLETVNQAHLTIKAKQSDPSSEVVILTPTVAPTEAHEEGAVLGSTAGAGPKPTPSHTQIASTQNPRSMTTNPAFTSPLAAPLDTPSSPDLSSPELASPTPAQRVSMQLLLLYLAGGMIVGLMILSGYLYQQIRVLKRHHQGALAGWE